MSSPGVCGCGYVLLADGRCMACPRADDGAPIVGLLDAPRPVVTACGWCGGRGYTQRAAWAYPATCGACGGSGGARVGAIPAATVAKPAESLSPCAENHEEVSGARDSEAPA